MGEAMEKTIKEIKSEIAVLNVLIEHHSVQLAKCRRQKTEREECMRSLKSLKQD